jgi:small subunit ribosomal protein S8
MSSINDPIADFLTRIRNACHAKKDEVSVPASKMKARLAEIFKDEGYIEDFTLVPDKRQGLLVIHLRYQEDGSTVIRGMRRESRPGRRIYVGIERLPKVRNGLGTAVLSTPHGMMTDRKARLERMGGEYICSIW